MTGRVKVAVLKTQNYKDTYDTVKDAVKLAGGFDSTIKKDSFVTLKPNLVRLPKKPIIKGMAKAKSGERIKSTNQANSVKKPR